MQVGGGAPAATSAKAAAEPLGPPAVTPPQANVPRKEQVGRPVRVAKPSQGCSCSTKEGYPT